jgi:hypothetical protein
LGLQDREDVPSNESDIMVEEKVFE